MNIGIRLLVLSLVFWALSLVFPIFIVAAIFLMFFGAGIMLWALFKIWSINERDKDLLSGLGKVINNAIILGVATIVLSVLGVMLYVCIFN